MLSSKLPRSCRVRSRASATFFSRHRTIRSERHALAGELINHRQDEERTSIRQLSLTKSMLQHWFAGVATLVCTRCRRAIFRRCLVRARGLTAFLTRSPGESAGPYSDPLLGRLRCLLLGLWARLGVNPDQTHRYCREITMLATRPVSSELLGLETKATIRGLAFSMPPL